MNIQQKYDFFNYYQSELAGCIKQKAGAKYFILLRILCIIFAMGLNFS